MDESKRRNEEAHETSGLKNLCVQVNLPKLNPGARIHMLIGYQQIFRKVYFCLTAMSETLGRVSLASTMQDREGLNLNAWKLGRIRSENC